MHGRVEYERGSRARRRHRARTAIVRWKSTAVAARSARPDGLALTARPANGCGQEDVCGKPGRAREDPERRVVTRSRPPTSRASVSCDEQRRDSLRLGLRDGSLLAGEEESFASTSPSTAVRATTVLRRRSDSASAPLTGSIRWWLVPAAVFQRRRSLPLVARPPPSRRGEGPRRCLDRNRPVPGGRNAPRQRDARRVHEARAERGEQREDAIDRVALPDPPRSSRTPGSSAVRRLFTCTRPRADTGPASTASLGMSSKVRSYPAATRASCTVGSNRPPVRLRVERQLHDLAKLRAQLDRSALVQAGELGARIEAREDALEASELTLDRYEGPDEVSASGSASRRPRRPSPSP